jgi:hypothetical protein
LFNSVGCDSIVTLTLSIKKSSRNSISVVSCNNYSWWQNGITYKKSGTYYDTIVNAVGCDSIVELNLTIKSSFERSESITTCTQYKWKVNNQTYFKSGNYSYIVRSKILGICDSVYYLNLTIANTLYGQDTVRTCESYKWPANNQIYKSTTNECVERTCTTDPSMCYKPTQPTQKLPNCDTSTQYIDPSTNKCVTRPVTCNQFSPGWNSKTKSCSYK